jgi:hypothetical protein
LGLYFYSPILNSTRIWRVGKWLFAPLIDAWLKYKLPTNQIITHRTLQTWFTVPFLLLLFATVVPVCHGGDLPHHGCCNKYNIALFSNLKKQKNFNGNLFQTGLDPAHEMMNSFHQHINSSGRNTGILSNVNIIIKNSLFVMLHTRVDQSRQDWFIPL